MKILLVNNYHYLRGGSERTYFDVSNLLKEQGHEVFYLSTINPKNKEIGSHKYFVKDYDLSKKYSLLKKIQIFFRIIHNFEAKKMAQKIIKEKKIDIVHLHNIYHHLSPVVIKVFKKNNIPLVASLHDYKMICPNYKMFNRGKVCTKCIKGNYLNCLKDKCIDDSYVKSLVLIIEAFINKKIYKKIDLFICPSKRQKEFFIKAGVDRKKLTVLPHFFETNNFNNSNEYQERDYLLYYGRLSREKGVDILIKALADIPNEKLLIVGEGEDKARLKRLVFDLGLGNRVEFNPWASGDSLTRTIKEAKAVVFPFIWEEVFGYTLLESLFLNKLIIASNIGAVPEIIDNGNNGILFNIGDINDLKDKILQIKEYKKYILLNTKKSILKYEQKTYYQNLMEIYKKLTNKQ
ncbi:glycosyltransferase family 4 protein [bacterium]|nr:glycosyltransferase family 4 protein [bacterium]